MTLSAQKAEFNGLEQRRKLTLDEQGQIGRKKRGQSRKKLLENDMKFQDKKEPDPVESNINENSPRFNKIFVD